jgi:hypothetical protein
VSALLWGCGGGSGGGGTAGPPASGTVLRSFAITVDRTQVRSAVDCAVGLPETHMCIGYINVPPLQVALGPFAAGSPEGALLQDRTGLGSGTVLAAKGPSIQEAASDAFVLLADARTFGIHLDTRSRGPAPQSSIDPLFEFEVFPPAAGAPDPRFMPFTGPDAGNVEVAFSFDHRVKRVTAASNSLAYGQAVFTPLDLKAERHFYFVVDVFGTQPLVDNVLIDSATGQAIVETGFRASPYGRNLGAGSFATPSPFVSPSLEGTGGHYEFRFNVDEFRRILAAVRTIDPRLSADPADYLFDDFHFNTEVIGDGEIGETIANIEVRLLRR